jgi:hypothetical protein
MTIGPTGFFKKAPGANKKSTGLSAGTFLSEREVRPIEQTRRTPREERAAQASKAKALVTIQVSGSDGRAGTHKLEYQAGKTLRQYLAEAQLISLIGKRRIYDMTNQSAGVLRTYYVPGPNAMIGLFSGNYTPASRFQRKGADAEQVAKNMGGGRKEVIFSMKYENQEEDK